MSVWVWVFVYLCLLRLKIHVNKLHIEFHSASALTAVIVFNIIINLELASSDRATTLLLLNSMHVCYVFETGFLGSSPLRRLQYVVVSSILLLSLHLISIFSGAFQLWERLIRMHVCGTRRSMLSLMQATTNKKYLIFHIFLFFSFFYLNCTALRFGEVKTSHLTSFFKKLNI